jgi:DNA excision repair protein ERCC-8
MSPIASHLLVACATQHPAVRLVDLRSGSTIHSLAGHHGALVSVEWSSTKEYLLASGGIDGCVRFWDVRKSGASLGLLDMEASTGIAKLGLRSREAGKAHNGAVNGISWTDDGEYLVTAGHDEKVRVWNMTTGANTLASFGPTLKNSLLSRLPLLIPPTYLTPPGRDILFYPNEQEILQFDLHEGKILKRLRGAGPTTAVVRSRGGERNVRNRVTAMAWCRAELGVYSAHSDGQIRGWLPKTLEDSLGEEEELKDTRSEQDESSKRKRQVLDDVFRDLTRQKITFG